MGDVGILGKREREVRRGRGRKEEERGREGKHKVCQPLVETRVKTYTLPLVAISRDLSKDVYPASSSH